MNIFVTGATGFLGGHFVRQAIRLGHSLVCLRRPNALPRIEMPTSVQWLERDSEGGFDDVFSTTDAFVHFLAAGVHPQPLSWQTAIAVNVTQSFRLWRHAAEAGVRRFVVAGSAMEYGAASQRFVRVPADAPLEPSGPYGTSKAMSSLLARTLARDYSLSLTYIRPFNLYGAGQFKENFWPSLREAAVSGRDFRMTDGTQIRDYAPVEDAADFFLRWVGSGDVPPGRAVFVNFGSGAARPLVDYAREWWTAFRASGCLRVGAIPSRKEDLARLVPDLEPKVST